MVAHEAHVALAAVEEHSAESVDDGDAQPVDMRLTDITAERGIVEKAGAERLGHLVVVHLKAGVYDIDLVLFLAAILIRHETEDEEEEDNPHAEEETVLEGFTS